MDAIIKSRVFGGQWDGSRRIVRFDSLSTHSGIQMTEENWTHKSSDCHTQWNSCVRGDIHRKVQTKLRPLFTRGHGDSSEKSQQWDEVHLRNNIMSPMALRIDNLYLTTNGSMTEKKNNSNKPWQPGLTMPVPAWAYRAGASLGLPCRGHGGRSSHKEHVTVASYRCIRTQNFSACVAVLPIRP